MAKKAKRGGKAAPKPKTAKQPAKKATPGGGPKSVKSIKKAAAPKAGAGHDFSGAVRKIVRKAGSPLTLAQIREEHSLRFSNASPTSVDRAVVSLVKSGDLSVASPDAAAMDAGPGIEALGAAMKCVVRDDPWLAIQDLLCKCYPGQAFTNVEIHDKLNNECGKDFLQITIDSTLYVMVQNQAVCKTTDGKKYRCCDS